MSLETLRDFVFTYDIESKYIVKHPSVIYTIVATYVVFVKWIGPALMENRKAFQLRNILIFYNFFQAFANTVIAYEIIMGIIEFWDARCMVKYSPDLPKMIERATKPGWWLFIVKNIDLLDTVFFVLRKKQSQITFLHVFHHAGMVVLGNWGITRLHMVPGFYIGIGFAINTIIHIVMYMYYGLSAIGPHMRKYMWWKKYLTLIQITQIFFVFFYLLFGVLTGCEELGITESLAFVYVFLNLVLFLNFYRKYKKE